MENRQVTININDITPIANTAYVDAGKENKVYNKTQVQELLENIKEGVIGSISPTQTLVQLNALEDGNYFAAEAGTYAFGEVVPVGWQYRFNKVGANWNVVTKLELPMQDLSNVENEIDFLTTQLSSKNILVNSFFKNTLTPWYKNENTFIFDIEEGYAHVNTRDATNTGLVQDIYFEAVEYAIEIRVKKNNENPTRLQFFSFSTENASEIVLDGTDWRTYRAKLALSSASLKQFVCKIVGTNSDLYIDYILLSNAAGSLPSTLADTITEVNLISENVGLKNVIKNYDFSQDLVEWNKNEAELLISTLDGNAKVDATNGVDPAFFQNPVGFEKRAYQFSIRYKKLSAGNASFRLGTPFQNAIQVNSVNGDDWEVFTFDTNFSASGSGLFMFAPSPDSVWLVAEIKAQSTDKGSIAADVADLKKGNKVWAIPSKNVSPSPFKNYLKPFIDKYSSRESDVTVVQIGDSISTNLKWSPPRPDANARPPFMTEYNINSYAEEKLRWFEQKYRRFDFSGVFTEFLGGGTSTARETDADNWGLNGGAYYYPLTKVIDGGTGAGVSFKMPAGQKRISLIVHTDKAYAASTTVSITGGAGKVQVYNGNSWVEANGFITSFKENNTLETLGFYTDNAQKRLKFRSLTDLSEKTITVQNIGAGRFGYWGIEYSPNVFMFTYIAAAKGSHNDAMLKRYESFMVDSFNPDLVIYQTPVLNSAFGVARATGSNTFGAQFVDRYNGLKAKGYLVVSYVLWAATYSNYMSNTGEMLYSVANNGDVITCQNDAANISYSFGQLADGAPFVNCFPLISELAKDKALAEGRTAYTSALVGSGPDGNTFTIDGIHLNKQGEAVIWRILESIFNF